jgi:lysophospholipase L1-like esterase
MKALAQTLALFASLISLSLPALGQLVQQYTPPRPPNVRYCCPTFLAKDLADELKDFNQLGRYSAENEMLRAQPVEPDRVVFLGDSITDIWKLPDYFPGKHYINRGISGQTTPQMLVRLFPDVINLKPKAMVLLAGTNDIAQNTGPETFEMVTQNIQAMTELAQDHGVKVILCALTPVSDYAAQKQTTNRPPADILKLNAWLRDYAARTGSGFVDYYTATVDQNGMLRKELSNDGLHPNAAGYKIMAPLVEAAIEKALGTKD